MSLKGLFNVVGCLNQGSFGKVYVAENISKKEFVALKVEKDDLKPSQILNESKIYSLLSGQVGFAKNCSLMNLPGSRVLVLELLGVNLLELFAECGHHFSLKTVLLITLQMLDRLETLHSVGYVHRDIKPQNVMIGRGPNSSIFYLVDFGLASQFDRTKKESGLPPLVLTQVTGNQLFASVGNHLNIEQTPKDDLESLGYMIVYLLNGKLPWSGLVEKNKTKVANILTNTKMTSSVYEIIGDAPEEFATYLRMIKALKSDEIPEYQKYRDLFMGLFKENGFEEDNFFDWTPIYKEMQFSIPQKKRRVI